MSRRWLNAAAGLAAVGLAGGFGYLAATSGPKPPAADPPAFAIEPGVLDLGTARQNQTLTGTAAVVNRLPVAVEVLLVSKSCSCADAEVEPRRIEPGQSAKLTLAWRTGSKRGAVSDRITVLAATCGERPGQIAVELVLQAEVQPDALVEPERIEFIPGEADNRVLRIRPGSYAASKLLGAYSTTNGLYVETDPNRGEVRVRYDPVVFGPLSGEVSVMVENSAPNSRWIRVAVDFAKQQGKEH